MSKGKGRKIIKTGLSFRVKKKYGKNRGKASLFWGILSKGVAGMATEVIARPDLLRNES